MQKEIMPSQFSVEQEIIDIVDQHDQVVAQMEREKAFRENIGYRRAVLAFLKNADGFLCFLKRAEHLSYCPNHYALVGGCVQAGESYDDAIKREVLEEVRIEVSEMKQLGIVTPQESNGSMFKAIYEIEVDLKEVQYCPTAFNAFTWLKPEAYHEEVASCRLNPVIPDLCYIVEKFYTKK